MTGCTQLVMPAATGPVVAAEVARHGGNGVETGGFLLAARDSGAASIAAFVGTAGITRARLFLRMSDLALDTLFAFAERLGYWIPAQFHSHEGLAFLSETDRQHGLRVQGFTTAVIPHFADPPLQASGWRWWRFDAGDWRSADCPVTANGDLHTVVFDEDGVRDR